MAGLPANVFVLGLDEVNLHALHDLPHLSRYRFHPLLSVADLTESDEIDFPALLDEAQRQLDGFDGSVDAIIGYWDFPVSSMVPILCERLGLPTTSLRAVVTCEHKYWSRLEQQKVTDAHPAFGIVDLEADPKPPPEVGFPMWLKPVKSFSSDLAYKVHDEAEFADAVERIRAGIGRVGQPFDHVLGMLDLPPEIAEVGGQACLAEAAVGGEQATVEGYVHRGEVRVQGVIDSLNYEGTSSFLRYQYPSRLPAEVTDRLIDISTRVLERIGLDESTFNIEYFWDRDTGAINLLEINPRLSQSHARLFEAVDGVPNHQCMVGLALGEDPELPHRAGEHDFAGKCFLRRFADGVVRRVPTAEEIEQVQRDVPGTAIAIIPAEGDRLSDLPGQDSYSYELADVFIGARDEADLEEKFRRCSQALNFEYD
ncbi:ATP-grasp domain-containing protein [Saccharopolyspora sp. CA-218241]|uniref:ATP-grasp domain-containing protein n=1 Tax=Saccharopolyspora sp. CA-218241 TaxID=3240027 RepID=UPI003D95A0FB